ncbi:alpha/beta hydrolase [uncultured Roseobacter sp.]|uniref:alpha/beta hydrolase n=1 Tax=uncultured Roseobacter sp. TaxID=114847 RepID=UPI002601990A|nr:alpha/beta hydrolase [uncultured Roseobacter sp.]
MPLLRINARDGMLTLHRRATPVPDAVRATRAAPGPAIIMIHGFKYAPESTSHCPHKKIFRDSTRGWPASLGYNTGLPEEGLGIAFGWYARGPLAQVHRRAADLGRALAQLVEALKSAAPKRPVHIIAHSMGVEIALSALGHLPSQAVQRMVLLTGASFTSHAETMLRTQAGRSAEVFNITSRENDLFDLAFERMVAAPARQDRAIGLGIDLPNVVNLQLDCADTLSGLATLGLPIAAPERRVCHWSSYRRPGVMALYSRLLRDPLGLPQARLAQLLPDTPDPRWSRLVKSPARALPKNLDAGRLAAAARVLRAKAGLFQTASTGIKAKKPAY